MIPKDWSQITIEQFVKLYPTFKTEGMTDKQIVNNKILQASIIKGISIEEAKLTPISEGEEIVKLLEQPFNDKIVKYFKHNGITYRFNTSANELNSGGYIGVMNAIKDDPIKNMHVSMFNLATPVKYSWLRSKWVDYKFKPSEVSDRMNDFKTLPISFAYPIAVFFLTLSKNLTNVTEDYLSQSLRMMNKELTEIKEDLQSTAGR